MLSILRTDAGLVAQVLTGKTNRFDELVSRHMNMVYGIAFSYTRNHADAEDVSQEAFLKAYRSLDTLQDSRKFGFWIGMITRNLARALYARRKREVEVLEQKKAQVTHKSDTAYEDMRELLDQQINTLDPIPREVLMLHYFSGYSTTEIAKSMNVSQAAVLKRLQRAREALGAKLIRELNIIPPAQNADKQHRRIIMSSITASGITWQLSGTSWASIAGSTLMSGKAIVTGLVVTGIVTASVILNPQPESSGSGGGLPTASVSAIASVNEGDIELAPNVTDDVTAEKEVAIETPIVLAEATVEAEVETEVTVQTADDSEKSPDDPQSLKGSWRVFGGYNEEEARDLTLGKAEFIREDNRLTVNASGELEHAVLKGEINTLHVVLTIAYINDDDSELVLGQMEGEFSEDFTVLMISGDLDLDFDGELDQFMVLRFEKMHEDEVNAEEALALAKEKMTTLQQAILKYMREEEKNLVKLSALKEGYLEDPTLLDRRDDEMLRYYPMSIELLNANIQSSENLLAANAIEQEFLSTHDPALLLEWEDALALAWGDSFPVGVRLLRLVNSKYNFTLEIRSQGGVRVIPEAEEVGSEEENAPLSSKQQAIRDSCANNMKQLGLVFKMFENECPGGYFPGGFRQAYPEYIVDMNVLICPGLANAEVGYEILFPASNAEFWKDMYYQVEGINPDEGDYPKANAIMQSTIPNIIEKEGCSGDAGRNVLFIDGHVEFILEENMDERIGAYLEYAYK